MASEREVNASRRNAQRSTGLEQKDRRHSLLASDAVLRVEDRREYLELLAALNAEHEPAGPLEEFCVRQMLSAQWRLLRVVRIETGLLASRLDDLRRTYGKASATSVPDGPLSPGQRPDEDTRFFGMAFKEESCGDPFDKLFRYEDMLRRSFYKALETLRQAKARRPDPPPGGVDQTKPVPVPDTAPYAAPVSLPSPERTPAPDFRRGLIVLRRPPAPATERILPDPSSPRELRRQDYLRFRAAALPRNA